MQDVIFNGAGERKPVGRASVELHFDNSQGRIGGQWGQYAEISIKRVLTRDGDSTYYINNIPVRRRDIHDLFLGTGLGPRAYAIIEQGMISRIIEAKPEELRIFLEEAAGVSKYKERRKETEGRLVRRPGKPGARRGHPAGAGQPAGAAGNPGAGRHRIPRARSAAEAVAAHAVVRQAAGRRPRARTMHDRDGHADGGAGIAAGRGARRRKQARGAARQPLCRRRRTAREAGRVLRRQRRSDAARAAAQLRPRVGIAADAAGRAADGGAGRPCRTGGRVDHRPRRRGTRNRDGAHGARIRGRVRARRACAAARARGDGGADIARAGRTRAEDRIDRAGRARGRDPPRQHRAGK